MGTLVKTGVLLGLVALGASYFDIFGDLINTVRVSLIGIELSRIDEAVQRKAASHSDARNARYPADQAEFETLVRDDFEDRGRDPATDLFGKAYVYQREPGAPPADYLVASGGPDQTLSTEDDIVLIRDGKKRRITHSPEETARFMEGEIQKQGDLKKQEQDEIKRMLEGSEIEADLKAGQEETLGEKLKGLVDQIKGTGESENGKKDGEQSSQDSQQQRQESLQGLEPGGD